MRRGGGGRAIVVALTVLLLLVVAIGAGLEGQIGFTGPIWNPGGTGASTATPEATKTPPPPPVSSTPIPHNTSPTFPWVVIVIVLAAIAVAIIVIFTLLWLRTRPRRKPTRRLTGIELSVEDAEAAEPGADLPTLRRGLVRASEILDSDREPRDAIVRAWIGLQEAAEDSGMTRRPSETPTEFTSRVFESVQADRDAARALLGLYLRVRFGSHPATAEDVKRAKEAVDALSATWPVRSNA